MKNKNNLKLPKIGLFFYLILNFFLKGKKHFYKKRNEYLKYKLKQCGKNIRLHGFIDISGLEKIEIGDNVGIGHDSLIWGGGGLKIGDNTIISHYCTIYTQNHNYSGVTLPYDKSFINKPVEIGKNVWIGTHCVILPGVKIGEGAIVGMGTTVTRDVPKFAIVGNQPHRLLKYRNKRDYIEKVNKKRILVV